MPYDFNPRDLRNRDVCVTDFQWLDLSPVEYRAYVIELLQIVIADADCAVAAMARALEGAEVAMASSAFMDQQSCTDIERLADEIGSMPGGAVKSIGTNWLTEPLQAFKLAFLPVNTDELVLQEALLWLRSARHVCESYCQGQKIAELRSRKVKHLN